MKKKSLFLVFLVVVSSKVFSCPEPIVSKDFVLKNLEGYTPGEIALIKKDLEVIEEIVFRSVKKQKAPVYLASAGGPGSAKSTVLETFLIKNNLEKDYVYIDPDRMSMRFMVNTYIPYLSAYNIANKPTYNSLLKEAYRKWRGGSNYISNTLLNKAAEKLFNIAHGSTSTSVHVENLYKRLKDCGYKITLLLCGAGRRTRLSLVNHRRRVQANVQSSTEDVISKGKLFPQRIETYFKYADKIYIYWTQTRPIKTILAAEYSKKDGLLIKDKRSFELFVKNNGKLPI